MLEIPWRPVGFLKPQKVIYRNKSYVSQWIISSKTHWIIQSVLIMLSFEYLITGGQGWCSDEGTCLPPMWPAFSSQIQCHMSVEFVGSLLCTKRFSPGTPVSTLLKNQHLTWFVLIANFSLQCPPICAPGLELMAKHLNKGPFLSHFSFLCLAYWFLGLSAIYSFPWLVIFTLCQSAGVFLATEILTVDQDTDGQFSNIAGDLPPTASNFCMGNVLCLIKCCDRGWDQTRDSLFIGYINVH